MTIIPQGSVSDSATSGTGLRFFALSMVAVTLLFLLNNVLTYWWGWPGLMGFLGHQDWFGATAPRKPLESGAVVLGWLQIGIYVAPVLAIAVQVAMTPKRRLQSDAKMLEAMAAYIVRAAFWGVLLIGVVDMTISFLRVENILEQIIGDGLAKDLGRTSFRGAYVHYPLIVLGFVIAYFKKDLGFIWFALLIVLAELLIVIARFVFSYEQVFMGDLVRFWYAALFLFASAYTLVEEGHVRVDILYTRFSARGKAWANCTGSLLFGMPLCWIILTRGLWTKATLINAPLISYEVSQSGYGMYVKYLMAGFLLIYAVSMMVQFCSSFLSNAAVLLGEEALEAEAAAAAAADEPASTMGRGAIPPEASSV